ncbi:MAG: hypothetical protein J5661_01660 [Bacteroidaceae bacterium]|nr:hypothetical protein [Bacteroidaceae bacterium]
MKKKYMKPFFAIKKVVMPEIMVVISVGTTGFGGGTGGTGDGDTPITVNSKYMDYDDFGTSDTFDDDY